jgi:hypothetical protein
MTLWIRIRKFILRESFLNLPYRCGEIGFGGLQQRDIDQQLMLGAWRIFCRKAYNPQKK